METTELQKCYPVLFKEHELKASMFIVPVAELNKCVPIINE